MITTFILTAVIVLLFVTSLSLGLLRKKRAIHTCAGMVNGGAGPCACANSKPQEGTAECAFREASRRR